MTDLSNHPLAERFNLLTPEMVFDAVETDGRRCTGRFIILNSYENRVYQLELDDGTVVVGKFYRPGRWSLEAIRDEHNFLEELNQEEIPVAVPIELSNGDTIGEVLGIRFALFPRIGGRMAQELNHEQVEMLGRLLARIHNVGARRTAECRLTLGVQHYGYDNLKFLQENQLIPDSVEAQYVATAEALLERIAPAFEVVPKIRLHGDCHMGNLIWTPDGPTFLDFDDMLNGAPTQDLWLLVGSYDDEGRRRRDRMVEAYSLLRDFAPEWLGLVEPMRGLRYINYATWIARRRHDPAFKQTFVNFGTVVYWQQQVLDLREQIARVDLAFY